MSRAHLYVLSPSGDPVPARGDDYGVIGGGSGGPPSADSWFYAAASGGIADDQVVALKAAAGANMANYLTQIDLMNADASVATEVEIRDGTTVIWRSFLPAMAANTTPVINPITFNPPLRSSPNAALNIKCATTSAVVYANARGYSAPSTQSIDAQVNSEIEITTAAGEFISDLAGIQIVLAA
jgi:hypothetical protein